MATRLPTKRGHGGESAVGMTAMEPEVSKPVSTSAREKAVLAAYFSHIGGKPVKVPAQVFITLGSTLLLHKLPIRQRIAA